LLEAQAEALELPLIEVWLEPKSSDAAYQRAFLDALGVLAERHPAVRHVAFGDLYLRDVRDYRDRLLADTPYRGLYPLWGRPTGALAESFVADGFEATLVCVDETQIDARFAGRRFDHSLLAELPASADPCGENGEFHTFVHGGPVFSRAIPVVTGELVQREGRFTYCDLLPA
jgi:diphthamide synthase (EF-2-diphthine--ammonia ligase)